MKQKLVVTLAVAVMALAGAREASEQFHRLKSFAGEVSGTGFLGALLVFASGDTAAQPRPARALVASSSTGRADAPRARRSATRQRPRRADVRVEDVRVEVAATALGDVGLAMGFAPLPRVLRLDARALEARAEAQAEHERLAAELVKLARTEVFLHVARLSVRDARAKGPSGFEMPEALRAGRELRRVSEKADKKAEDSEGATRKERDGRDETDEQGATFFAPAAGGGSLLNCDTEPRR